MRSERTKVLAQLSLKLEVWLSTSLHQNSAACISCGHMSDCILQEKCFHIVSNQWLVIPMCPKLNAGRYLCVGIISQQEWWVQALPHTSTIKVTLSSRSSPFVANLWFVFLNFSLVSQNSSASWSCGCIIWLTCNLSFLPSTSWKPFLSKLVPHFPLTKCISFIIFPIASASLSYFTLQHSISTLSGLTVLRHWDPQVEDEQLDNKGVWVAPHVMFNPFLFVRHVGVVNCPVVLVAGAWGGKGGESGGRLGTMGLAGLMTGVEALGGIQPQLRPTC